MRPITRSSLLVFGAFLILFPPVSHLLGFGFYVDVLIFIGIYSLITIGLTLLTGYAGQISLGHAAFFGIGAYTSGILTATYALSPWPAMALGMALSAAVAFLAGAPSLRLRGHYLAMATLAFGIIVFIVFNQEAALTGGPDGLSRIPGLELLGLRLNTPLRYYYFTWGVAYGAFLLTANIIQSRAGRALRSIHDSETASAAMGVNTSAYKIRVLVYSAALAALAGSLYAHYVKFINPATFDLSFSVKLLIMIVVGGMHSIWGAVVGAALITFLSNEWLQYFSDYEVIAYGAILLLITIFFPGGLVEVPEFLRQRLARRRRGPT